MKAEIHDVINGGVRYRAIMIWCPGCSRTGADDQMYGGAHLLAIEDTQGKEPFWGWNGDLEKVTLTPSILTRIDWDKNNTFICHSFLTDGVWNFLGDCTHALVNQQVPMVDLPDWLVKE